jgi:hypothetical protein
LHSHLSDFVSALAKLTRNLIFVPTFSRQHTETYSNNNRRHSERDCHRSTTTTHLWNADTPTSSSHTEIIVHCCHCKHTVASSRTLLSHHLCDLWNKISVKIPTILMVVFSVVTVSVIYKRTYVCRYLLGPCTAAIDVCPFGLLYISSMIDDDDDDDDILEQLVE